jgi:transposase
MGFDECRQRGLEIAATCKVSRKGQHWFVPSQSGDRRRYRVTPHRRKSRCSCPAFELHNRKCKHIFAVEFAMQRKRQGKATLNGTDNVLAPKPRRTYPQNWPAYNQAQTKEKEHFLEMLKELCAGVPDFPQTRGRPRMPLADALFCICFKVYSTKSARRFMTDLREVQAKGFIQKSPHFNSILNYMEKPELESILVQLIRETSLPLTSVEQDFAVDSSGFTTSRFTRWFDHKYGGPRKKSYWVKVHLMCGVKTNIVTAVEIKNKDAADTKQMPALVEATGQNFKLREVSADKIYGSLSNYRVIDRHGATPFIAFKRVHNGWGGGLWQMMYHYFMYKREKFLSHYHKRSNVESTFSMIKTKFGDHVRSKTDMAMKNEVYCKIICHNICVLIHEMYELGIEPTFWKENRPAQEITLS